jgi:hypothetical protein
MKYLTHIPSSFLLQRFSIELLTCRPVSHLTFVAWQDQLRRRYFHHPPYLPRLLPSLPQSFSQCRRHQVLPFLGLPIMYLVSHKLAYDLEIQRHGMEIYEVAFLRYPDTGTRVCWSGMSSASAVSFDLYISNRNSRSVA